MTAPVAIRLHADTASAEPFSPDPSRMVEGDGRQAVVNQFASADGRFNCGVWSSTPGIWRVAFTENEFCHLLEGVVTVTPDGGTPQTFRAGDAFVMPAGFQGTWAVVEAARKYYAVYE